MSFQGKIGALALDWQNGFALREGKAESTAVLWHYKFSQLRGSSDDGKSKLKLHFHDHETRSIDTKVRTGTFGPNTIDREFMYCLFFSGIRMPSIAEPTILHACFSNSKGGIGRSIIFTVNSTILSGPSWIHDGRPELHNAMGGFIRMYLHHYVNCTKGGWIKIIVRVHLTDYINT